MQEGEDTGDDEGEEAGLTHNNDLDYVARVVVVGPLLFLQERVEAGEGEGEGQRCCDDYLDHRNYTASLGPTPPCVLQDGEEAGEGEGEGEGSDAVNVAALKAKKAAAAKKKAAAGKREWLLLYLCSRHGAWGSWPHQLLQSDHGLG